MSILSQIVDFLGPIQLIIITTIVSVLTYHYFKWKRLLSYWSSRNIDGPKPLPIFGNFLAKFFIPKPQLELQWYRQFGRLYGTYTGDKPDLTVARPELIKQILVKDFHRFRNRREQGSGSRSSSATDPLSKNMFNTRDDTWKRIRAIASPTFTSGKLRKLYTLIGQCCDEFDRHLDGMVNHGRDSSSRIELKKLMGQLTMDVIARCAFATKPNTYTDDDPDSDQFTRSANSIFAIPVWRLILSAVLPTWVRRLRLVRRILRGPDVDFFVHLGRKLMAHRRQTLAKHNDFLQLLMDAEYTGVGSDGSVEHRESSDQQHEAHYLNEGHTDQVLANREAIGNVLSATKRLTEDEILGQCFIFFIAGYETTATTLAFCTYELALNPRLQDRLYDEVNGAAVQQNGNIDYELLSSLPFLDSLISETLRKYPPVLRLEREAMDDIQLGGDDTTGSIHVEKGTVCEIPVYAIHHDPQYYPEPDRFNPDRFMPDNRHQIKPYTYLPFGSGPRNCIGMRFALLESKLALAKLSRRYRFRRLPETDVPVVYNKGRDLLQARRLVVGIEKRDEN
ncbi:cytochrome P450 3A11-like [Oppia nitens]|uniref:cytochrome P450 3A11-like n=1 Tax=Oppia nitens TaxID=1686743 RepID=UPI0023DA2B97|nr:cytochrome P450 3A11-like [Oppia nitens]